MKSSTILSKSHPILENYAEFSNGIALPNFLKEIAEFGKCIYYMERYLEKFPNSKKLIFETKNITRWEKVQPILKRILLALTKDTQESQLKNLDISFEDNGEIEEQIEEDTFQVGEFYANVLFSGGADSTFGAFHYVEKKHQNVIFTHIEHRNTPSKAAIDDLIISKLHKQLITLNGVFKNSAHWRGLATEKSTVMYLNQTRTFLFLTHAVAVNYAKKIRNLQVTENGPFTINPPFTDDVKFTNTTNPFFIDLFNQFLDGYLKPNLIHVNLPFLKYTKAEMMAGMPIDLLIKTHSCSREFNKRKSCFNCYACWYRRFSAYAYNNKDDDKYQPTGTIIDRYDTKNEKTIFQSDYNFFKEHPDERLLINLIEFCTHTLNKNNFPDYSIIYGKFITKARFIDEKYYHNKLDDVIRKFALEMLSGLDNFFNEHMEFQNSGYAIWDTFTKCINNLTTNNIISSDFAQKVEERIRTVANSIIGEQS